MKNILICGAGRSGTSMLAGLFSDCGYFQGEDLYPPREANPRGFFENWKINSLNERIILSSLEAKYGPDACGLFRTFYRQGQYWLARLPMDLHCVATADNKKEISDLVSLEPFCYKDPRFCYTLEPWLDTAHNALALCVFRHPGVVIASILKELQSADYLRNLRVSVVDLYETWWHMYMRMLSLRARSREVYFVSYNDLFRESKLAEIEQLVGAKLNRLFPDKFLDRSDYDGDLDELTTDCFSALSEFSSRHFSDQSVKASADIVDRFMTKSRLHHIPVDVARPTAPQRDISTAEKIDSRDIVFSEIELQALVYRLYEQQKDLEAEIEGLRNDSDTRGVRIGELESVLIQREQSIAMLTKENNKNNHEIAAFKESSSWRITAPFRAVKRWWLRIVHI